MLHCTRTRPTTHARITYVLGILVGLEVADGVRTLARARANLLDLQRLTREVRAHLIQVRHHAQLVGHRQQHHVGGFEYLGDSQTSGHVERLLVNDLNLHFFFSTYKYTYNTCELLDISHLCNAK